MELIVLILSPSHFLQPEKSSISEHNFSVPLSAVVYIFGYIS